MAAALGSVLVAFLGLLVVVGSDEQTPGLNGVVCAPAGGAPGGAVSGFSGAQLANAAAIVAAGVEVGAPQRAQVIAVATAMQESQLLMYANAGDPVSMTLPHDRVGNDHDSVGLFQQRAGWGPVQVRMDAKASAKLFYGKLLALPGWDSMPLTEAAQSVQISALADAYTRWEQPANEVIGSVAGITCTGGAGGALLPANPLAKTVVQRALSQTGVPYVWAGGNAQGPTDGGFDCSGLMVYAFAGIAVNVPHQTQAIWAAFQPAITDPNSVQPGDMVLFSNNARPNGIHHVGLYLGAGKMVHAPETGSTVKVVDDIWANPYWKSQFIGAVRAMPTGDPRS